MNALQDFNQEQIKQDLPDFKAGDTVKVHCLIKEGNKERVQIFQGLVIARHNKGISSSFTVRKVSDGIGVERVFPLHAPFIQKIEKLSVGKVRRAKLYYLRNLFGKKARIATVDTRQKEAAKKAAQKAAEKKAEESKVEKAPAEAAKKSASSPSEEKKL